MPWPKAQGAVFFIILASLASALTGAAACTRREERPLPGPIPATLKSYQPVTADRLITPRDGDWAMLRRTYDGWSYSPLAQITTSNVSRLQPVWVLATGQTSAHEAPPVVNSGVMFVATPGNQVMAVDVKSGSVLWRYRRNLPDTAIYVHRTSRGVALFGDKVYFASADAVLVAINAANGREAWAVKVDENANGYYMTGAPLVADGKVIVGVSGGELGVRGFLAAYDPETGAQKWRTYTVPAPGEPGSETWPAGDQWKTGGASTWITGNYDPRRNIIYWGTGNGGPWMGDRRPGDNLYTSSTVALDAATGRITGYHQYQPNESWDWDEVAPPVLVDYERNGRTINGLIDVSRSGYLWFLERKENQIGFVDAKPYVKQNVFRSIDPKTGRPDIDPDRKPGTGKKADYCPSVWGGKNWPSIAFNPRTRFLYVPANENTCGDSIGVPIDYAPGRGYSGATVGFRLAPGTKHVGEVQAWNVDTAERVWTHQFATSSNWGPILTTGGGLVFSGGTSDRLFRAFDARTGSVLWQFPTNSGIVGQPTSFEVDGVQYVAVQSGWGADARAMQIRLNAASPGRFPEVPEGGAIWLFALN